MTSAVPWRWAGMAHMPSRLANHGPGDPVFIIWAELDITSGKIELRLRPAGLRVLLLTENLTAVPGDDVVIYPAHQQKPPRWRGIGIQLRNGRSPSYWFWTSRSAEVLGAATAAGFVVSGEEREKHERLSSD